MNGRGYVIGWRRILVHCVSSIIFDKLYTLRIFALSNLHRSYVASSLIDLYRPVPLPGDIQDSYSNACRSLLCLRWLCKWPYAAWVGGLIRKLWWEKDGEEAREERKKTESLTTRLWAYSFYFRPTSRSFLCYIPYPGPLWTPGKVWLLASSRTGLVKVYCIKLYTEFPAVLFAVHEACFRFFSLSRFDGDENSIYRRK